MLACTVNSSGSSTNAGKITPACTIAAGTLANKDLWETSAFFFHTFQRLALENLNPYGTCRVFGPSSGFRPECAAHKNDGKRKKKGERFFSFSELLFSLGGRS